MKTKNLQGTAKNSPMSAKEAATYTGFSVSQLKRWRSQNLGPIYTKHIGRIYYHQQDLDNFLNRFTGGNLRLNGAE